MPVPPVRARSVSRSRSLARSRLLVVTAVSLLAALVLAGCGSASSKTASDATTGGGSTGTLAMSGDPVTVRLGYFPNVTHAPALVGVQEGLFDARARPTT